MFHISKENLGRMPTFTPRTYSQDSVKEPRICVAPKIEGCFSATDWFDVWDDDNKIIYIYETLTDEGIVPCTEAIKDKYITDEHWIHNEVKMKLIHAVYPSSKLYQKLLNASCIAWSEWVDRAPCMDLNAQQKEMDLMTEIFKDVKWGVDNLPAKDLDHSFENSVLNVSV